MGTEGIHIMLIEASYGLTQSQRQSMIQLQPFLWFPRQLSGTQL